MAIFHRPATHGEGTPIYLSPGTIYSIWGGWWIGADEVQPLGSVYLDLTPHQRIEMDLSPSKKIFMDVSPHVAVELDLTPAHKIYLETTPHVDVEEM